jgi:hypothetical protein
MARTTEAGDVDLAFRLVIAINVNGVPWNETALGWAEAASVMSGAEEHVLLPDVLNWAAWNAVNHAEYERGRDLVAAMYAAEERLGVEPAAQRMHGPTTLALFTGAFDEATGLAERWIALGRAADDDYQVVQGLTILAATQMTFDGELAARTAQEAVELGRQVGAPGILSWALSVLSSLIVAALDSDRVSIVDEAAEYALLVGNGHAAAHTLAMAAVLYRGLGEPRIALEKAIAAGAEARRVGSRLGLATADFAAAGALLDLGELDAGVMLIAHEGTIDTREWGSLPGDRRGELRAAALDALGAERVAELELSGAQLTDDGALDLARTAAERSLRV